MRILPVLLLLPLCAAPALAQTAAPSQPAAATAQAAAPQQPAAKSAGATSRPAVPHHRMGWEQRFAQANTSHDGHLTRDQARAGYVTVARYFDQIDTDHKGYVTLDDVRAWHKHRREAHRRNGGQPADPLRPRPALHRTLMPEPAPNTTHQSQATPGPQDSATPTVSRRADPKAPS